MESHEVEMIEALTAKNDELRYLWSRHQSLESDLARLATLRNPTDDERREMAEIKRNKLKGKERIHAILDQHRGL